MIYGNHDKRKGDIVRIAVWDDPALLMAAWDLDIKSNSGPQRRAVCERVSMLEFAVTSIDYYQRKIGLSLIGKSKKGQTWIAGQEWQVRVHLDDTNLIRVGRLGNKE